MAKQDDGLFLLEVLIDKIVFVKSPCFSDKDFRTCVNIECSAVEPLEICDDDPGACIAKSGGPFVKSFNNGKSCLFSLNEADISKAMSSFPIKVSVYKSLPCGCLPTKIIMGEATIDMTKEFVQARNKFLEDPNTVSYQALKDSFRIVGSDGVETGAIAMFLRISCFGKLIITRFQGANSPPSLGAGGKSSSVVDRSCNPQRPFQTDQDPCACGAARSGASSSGPPRGGRFGSCPIAKDPYNSMPCEDPDDPCFCSGPKPAAKQQMECRNTDQYCLHVPEGTFPSLPFFELLTEDQKGNVEITTGEVECCQDGRLKRVVGKNNPTQSNVVVKECLNVFFENLNLTARSHTKESTYNDNLSREFSLYNFESNKRGVSENVDCWSQSSQSLIDYSLESSLYGRQETTVYMTLCDVFSHQRSSSTQATASINKCLQAKCDYANENDPNIHFGINQSYCTSSNMSSVPYKYNSKIVNGQVHCSDVYFFGRKKDKPNPGMGCCSGSKTRLQRCGNVTATPVKSETCKPRCAVCIQAQSQNLSACAQTKKTHGCSAGTSTSKGVSIKDNKSEKGFSCPGSAAGTKGDMIATVSHIRIGPREPCPVHGRDSCQGPKCVIASSASEDQQAPVKVSTVTNPRRGVFELVIRRMTGAPLAKNELMLEWTPPPSRPTPCGGPCPVPYYSPRPCRPPQCKMIVCRQPPCKTKCCKKVCKKPCGPMPCGPKPCRSVPCKKYSRSPCCEKPCRSCKPCPPPSKCRPCLPCATPCSPPCSKFPCSSPCKSSPCLRPCPVGRKKPRKARSQPRIRSHRKLVSPCCNRSKTCPVVRCRSVPGPCFACCAPPCSLRKCCSMAPCKPLKCCKSSCSTCCE